MSYNATRDALVTHVAAIAGLDSSRVYGYETFAVRETPCANIRLAGAENHIYVMGGKRRIDWQFEVLVYIKLVSEGDTESAVGTMIPAFFAYFDTHKRVGWNASVVDSHLEAVRVEVALVDAQLYRRLVFPIRVVDEEVVGYA